MEDTDIFGTFPTHSKFSLYITLLAKSLTVTYYFNHFAPGCSLTVLLVKMNITPSCTYEPELDMLSHSNIPALLISLSDCAVLFVEFLLNKKKSARFSSLSLTDLNSLVK